MAVVHSPAIKPHQHVAGREHEDDHRHEHEDDGLRLSVAAERLIEGPLNMHVPPPFIIAIAPSKHNSVHLLLVQFRWQKDGGGSPSRWSSSWRTADDGPRPEGGVR